MLSFSAKPKIIKGLEDVDVQEGESAVFSVQLADGKNVNIKWYAKRVSIAEVQYTKDRSARTLHINHYKHEQLYVPNVDILS